MMNLHTFSNVAFVTEFAMTRLQLEGISSLFDDMGKKWAGLHDTQGNKLVVGVKIAATKTDACKSYAVELITRYMTAQGMTLQNWSPESLRSQSRDREGGLAAIGVQDYRSHEDLFKWVMTFVIGIDPLLIDAAFALKKEDYKLSSAYLVYWLLNKHKFIVTSSEYDEQRKPDLKQLAYNWPRLMNDVPLLRRENIDIMLTRLLDIAQNERYIDLEKDDFLMVVVGSTILEPTFELAGTKQETVTKVVVPEDVEPVAFISETKTAHFAESPVAESTVDSSSPSAD